MKTIGELTCQAAVFVFKSDSTQNLSWTNAQRIEGDSKKEFDYRAELHETPLELCEALKRWTENVNPENAFLCINAHMGQGGIGPTGHGPWVSWEELYEALTAKVYTLWLVGCTSRDVLAVWRTPKESPVRGYMLVTDERENHQRLLLHFAREIALGTDPEAWSAKIVPYDQMPSEIRANFDGGSFQYLDARDPDVWQPCNRQPDSSSESTSSDEDNTKTLEATWVEEAFQDELALEIQLVDLESETAMRNER